MTPSEPRSGERHGVYGRRLGDCFGLEQAPQYICVKKSEVAVTQIRCDRENNGLTAPIPVEDALLVTMQLRDCAHHDLWIDGKPRRTGPLRRGDVSIYDLRTSPMVNSTSAFRNMHLYLPRSTLDAIALQEAASPIDLTPHEPGLGLSDPVLAGLALSLESAFHRPQEITRIFVDHVTTAITAHLLRLFSASAGRKESGDVWLSSRQERIARELLSVNLDGDIGTAELAEACGLSVPGFRQGFWRATGTTPHQWLMQLRVERAFGLLSQSRRSLAEVARLSGFADVRHMRRVFMVLRGVTPEGIRKS